jgi:hypothetical protein
MEERRKCAAHHGADIDKGRCVRIQTKLRVRKMSGRAAASSEPEGSDYGIIVRQPLRWVR